MVTFGTHAEPFVRYYSQHDLTLRTHWKSSCSTVSGRQFFWGGSLPKSNGGVQRFLQASQNFVKERTGRKELDCETDTSNRDESRSE